MSQWQSEIERLESSKDIMDVDNLLHFITKFKVFYQETTLKEEDYRDSYPLVKYALKDTDKPPNTLQLAVASCAVQLLEVHSKQFHTWVGGGGKSRIMAAIGLLILLTQPTVRMVRFVFINELLMLKDQQDFAGLWELLPNSSKVGYQIGLEAPAKRGEVLVVDEGDFFLF